MKLICDVGNDPPLDFVLVRGPNLLGRALDGNVVVRHPSLSRRHACVLVERDVVHLKDLQSKNGTYLKGRAVTETEISAGDIFTCGDVRFRLVADEAEGSARPRPPTPVEELSVAPARASARAGQPEQPSADPNAITAGEGGPADAARLVALLRASEILAGAGTIESVLERVLELALQILPIDHAAVLLVDPGGEGLTVRASRSRRQGAAYAYSKHVVEHVLSHGKAALFENAGDDLRLRGARSISEQAIRSSMCVPLRPRQDLLGILYADNRAGARAFDRQDLAFLAAFGRHAAIAVDNALLTMRLEQEAVLRSHLLRFFPPSTACRIIASGDATLETSEGEATVLFCDICDFTEMSSSMRPREVIELLNEYFRAITAVVFEYGGTLEKYIGDALLAVWGAPFARTDDAALAIQAAIEIQRTLEQLSRSWQVRGRPVLRVHIGLHTGPVAAGNIGSMHYLQYATIGRTTNLASRICDLAGADEIVVSEATLARARELALDTVAMPPARVKGCDETLHLRRVRW